MTIRKNTLKYLLDAVMLLLLVLMYDKMAVSMAFHEIGGLFLIGLFVIHLLFNGKWIAAVTQRLFSNKTPAKIRLGYCVDALLLATFTLVGISGVLISKELFSFQGGSAWKTIHYSASAFAILLMGVHLGLHWNMIRAKLMKKNAVIKRGARVAGIGALCLVLAFGAYSMAATSFARWLSMPFQTASGELPGNGGEGFDEGRGQHSIELQTAEGSSETAADSSAPVPGGDADSQAAAGAVKGGGEFHGSKDGGQGSLSSTLLLIANYLSITAVFAAITRGVEQILNKRRQTA